MPKLDKFCSRLTVRDKEDKIVDVLECDYPFLSTTKFFIAPYREAIQKAAIKRHKVEIEFYGGE